MNNARASRCLAWIVACGLLVAPSIFAQEAVDPGANVVLIQVIYQPRDASPSENLGVDPKFFIASNVKDWDPKGFACNGWGTLNKVNHDLPPPLIKIASLPREVALAPDFEFRVTRGTWETAEVAADGSDLPPRIIDAAAGTETYAGLVIRVDVAGWADQRGTRWPKDNAAAATAPSTSGTHGAGIVMSHDLASASLGNTRKVRVWLPPGYTDVRNESTRYPVLYMHDGQNCFDPATSLEGEWGIDETLVRLIGAGRVPPMIVVGIDSIASTRTNEYSPIVIGSGANREGGAADAYLRFVTDEVMPFIARTYRIKTGPANTAMGGASLGGLVTLHAAMSMPGVFGAILIESPSLWVGDGEMLRRLGEQKVWPQRIALAMGTKEKGIPEQDARWVEQARQAEAMLRTAGLDDSRLRVVIEEGAAHDVKAWSGRFEGLAEFLFAR